MTTKQSSTVVKIEMKLSEFVEILTPSQTRTLVSLLSDKMNSTPLETVEQVEKRHVKTSKLVKEMDKGKTYEEASKLQEDKYSVTLQMSKGKDIFVKVPTELEPVANEIVRLGFMHSAPFKWGKLRYFVATEVGSNDKYPNESPELLTGELVKRGIRVEKL